MSKELLFEELKAKITNEAHRTEIANLLSSDTEIKRRFTNSDNGLVDVERAIQFHQLLSEEDSVWSPVEVANAMCSGISRPLPQEFDSPQLRETCFGSGEGKGTSTQIVFLLHSPLLFEPEMHQSLTIAVIYALSRVKDETRNEMIIELANHNSSQLSNLVAVLQQWIAVSLIEDSASPQHIIPACRAMGILFEANNNNNNNNKQRSICPNNVFYSDAINSGEFVNLQNHYRVWTTTPNGFSLCHFPFLLDPHSKSNILRWESETQMMEGFRQAIFQHLFTSTGSPYLVVRVRRDHIIQDAVTQIQSVDLQDLKKPLKVVFSGEEGIDEGGVQKEFFQILTRQLFDVNYGMFSLDSDTNNYWFNRSALEEMTDGFELVGILLGLAIYNSIILNISFPLVVYKKLVGDKLDLSDLREINTQLYRSLTQLLEYEESGDETVENVFSLNFEVSWEAFGEMKSAELCDGGADRNVTAENREEFVELYTQHMLTQSIKSSFNAFQRGFLKVCGGRALSLFTSEELELLTCGSQSLDFNALQKACVYDGGFTETSPLIVQFWEIIHSLTMEQKRLFLTFTTGSDRAPIRGLGNLPEGFTIVRNGPDSNRLPTAHTCFNHLLLPEYSDRAKLERLLLTAINNAEGFGLR